jgi:hypothetical protein
LLFASPGSAQSYHDSNLHLVVEADNKEGLRLAQRAAKTAYRFFNRLGYHTKVLIRIKYQPAVLYKWAPDDYERVYGYAEHKSGTIYMTHWDESWLLKHNVFRQKMTPELYQSLLVHEICHLISNAVAEKVLGIAVSEYISYAAQIDSLEKQTIHQITESYLIKPFKTREVNSLNLWDNAHRFGVRSYLHYQNSGGSIVGGILAGRIDPDRKLFARFPGMGG